MDLIHLYLCRMNTIVKGFLYASLITLIIRYKILVYSGICLDMLLFPSVCDAIGVCKVFLLKLTFAIFYLIVLVICCL